MRIKDKNGRVGVVVENRGHCVFARPEGCPSTVSALDVGQPVSGRYMTVTAWYRQPDGDLIGLWYDSKPGNTVIRATIMDD